MPLKGHSVASESGLNFFTHPIETKREVKKEIGGKVAQTGRWLSPSAEEFAYPAPISALGRPKSKGNKDP